MAQSLSPGRDGAVRGLLREPGSFSQRICDSVQILVRLKRTLLGVLSAAKDEQKRRTAPKKFGLFLWDEVVSRGIERELLLVTYPRRFGGLR